jgi:hypothetical protein
VQNISPYLDPGTYKNLKSVLAAGNHIAAVYGSAANSPDKQSQSDTDQVVAESITMNNALFDYAKERKRANGPRLDFSLAKVY